MPVDEHRRLRLYEAARERLGQDAADTLMELLPPMDPSELATKRDLALTRAELREEMAELRGEMAELRGEMAELRSELCGEIADLRSGLRSDIAALQISVTDMMREQTNRMLVFVVPTMLTAVGLSVAASRLAG